MRLRPAFAHRRISIVLSTSIICLTHCLSAIAAEEIKISTIQIKPTGYLIDGSKSTGSFVEIGNRIAREAGYEPVNQVEPYPRVVQHIITGKSDFAMLFTNSTLEKHAVQVVDIIELTSVVHTKKGLVIKSITDLHGKRVGVLRNAQYSKRFDEDVQIVKYQVKDYNQSIMMLLLGRLDAVIGESDALYFALDQTGHSLDDLGPALIVSTNMAKLHLSKKSVSEEKVIALRKAVEKLRSEGYIKATYYKHLKSSK